MMQKTGKIYWMLRFLAQAVAVLFLVASIAYFGGRALLCSDDLVDVTAIPASRWELRSTTYGCSIISGPMTIAAEDKVSHERVKLVTLDSVDDVKIAVDRDAITLTLPADVTFTRYAERFDKYRVVLVQGK